MSKTLNITPDTKTYNLLEAFPQLEDALIEMTPVFKKLKNPVLRKTIAKVTTLRQAAVVGQIQLDELISRLRKEVGQDKINVENNTGDIMIDVPNWFDSSKVVDSLDAIPIVNGGGHPLDTVFRAVKELKEGEIFELITPFIPFPLIEKVEALGYNSWTNQTEETIFKTYFIQR